MSDFNSEQLAERTQDHLNEYIIAADRKASILVTGQFAFLGLAANALPDFSHSPPRLFRWSVIATAFFGILAVLLAVIVIYPRTPSPEEGYIYWGNITKHKSCTAFHEAVESLNDSEAFETLNKDNYSLARVAEKKYEYLRWSLRSTVAMVLFAVAAGVMILS